MSNHPPPTPTQHQAEAGTTPKSYLASSADTYGHESIRPVEVPERGEEPTRRNMSADEFLQQHKFQNFDEASEAIKELQQRAHELVTAGLENISSNRFTPEYDETIQKDHVKLNKRISGLAIALMQDTPTTAHKNWAENSSETFWDFPGDLFKYEKVTKLALKRLLTQAMWKYFVIQVFNDPFATFEVKESEGDLVRGLRGIHKSLPTETRENWRFLFIQNLERTKRDRNGNIEQAFSKWLQDALRFPDSLIEKHKTKVTSAVNAISDFARMLALQKAQFTSTRPSSYDGEEDCVTYDGTSVGINGEHEDDESRTLVGILTTPTLLKWGDRDGLNAQECIVIQKAFVGMSFLEDQVP
ncbi:hypothetical protein FSARC_6565 [Fusarium sarcochroum]|uniref:Uncharacterized protein n=1 Tax=Fusarium sarcochroum TaxID=1208366 RepID=A0A8H4TWX4_9HYPO|nr:hypothetical protein FSARC_6565 [Fusarium sarcochroum]